MLLDEYWQRARAIGRNLGWRAIDEREIDIRPSDRQREALALIEALPHNARIIGLDETGRALNSHEFASLLDPAQFSQNAKHLVFVIGGATGFASSIRARFQDCLSFGRMTLPHRLARIVLAEQIYRGLSIRAGAAYHQDGE